MSATGDTPATNPPQTPTHLEALLRVLMSMTGTARATLHVGDGDTAALEAAVGFADRADALAFAVHGQSDSLRVALDDEREHDAVVTLERGTGGAPVVPDSICRLLVSIVPALLESAHQSSKRGEVDRRFVEAFENAPLGITMMSARPASFGTFLRVNRAYCAMIGYDEADIVGKYFTEFLAPDDHAEAIAQMEDLVSGRIALMQVDVRMVRRDGECIWVRLTRSLMCDAAGEPVCFFTHLEDITKRRADETELAQLNARLQRSLHDAPIGMALTSIEPQTLGQFLEVNPALSRITGISLAALTGMRLEELLHPDARARAGEMLRKLVARESASCRYQERCVRVDGNYGWLAVHMSIAYDSADRPMYCIAQIIDITQQKEAEHKLEHLAYHDSLTSVLNRRGLSLAVKERFIDRSDAVSRSAMLVLDLDHFQYVNDTMGHAAGDLILTKVASILRGACEPDTIIARLGGDEFLLILIDADERAALTAAEHIRRLITSCIVLSNDSDIRATASVGIVLVDAWSNQTIDDAITAADAALARAKAQGRNRSCVAASLVSSHTALREELALSQRIVRALERDEFELWAQPILNLRTGIVERYELLLRMAEGDGTIRFPGEFLPVAERAGLMTDIDRWVVNRAIELASIERRAGRQVLFEVNLSGVSLTNEGVATFIENALRSTDVDPRMLAFEITETIAIENMEQACRFAEKIAALGCPFALDDFGAGFSSFYYLKYLPFSDLKIDGEFIRNLTTNVSDQHIVRAIVEVARGLGKSTIAEFVGDAETAVLLQSYGVDFAQGYYIGEPLPWESARKAAAPIAIAG